MRPALIGIPQLRDRTREIAVACKREAPRVVAGRQIGRQRDRIGISLLRTGPVAAEAIAVQIVITGSERSVGLVVVPSLLLEKCRLTDQ
jgi:hypothetical protein